MFSPPAGKSRLRAWERKLLVPRERIHNGRKIWKRVVGIPFLVLDPAPPAPEPSGLPKRELPHMELASNGNTARKRARDVNYRECSEAPIFHAMVLSASTLADVTIVDATSMVADHEIAARVNLGVSRAGAATSAAQSKRKLDLFPEEPLKYVPCKRNGAGFPVGWKEPERRPDGDDKLSPETTRKLANKASILNPPVVFAATAAEQQRTAAATADRLENRMLFTHPGSPMGKYIRNIYPLSPIEEVSTTRYRTPQSTGAKVTSPAQSSPLIFDPFTPSMAQKGDPSPPAFSTPTRGLLSQSKSSRRLLLKLSGSSTKTSRQISDPADAAFFQPFKGFDKKRGSLRSSRGETPKSSASRVRSESDELFDLAKSKMSKTQALRMRFAKEGASSSTTGELADEIDGPDAAFLGRLDKHRRSLSPKSSDSPKDTSDKLRRNSTTGTSPPKKIGGDMFRRFGARVGSLFQRSKAGAADTENEETVHEAGTVPETTGAIEQPNDAVHADTTELSSGPKEASVQDNTQALRQKEEVVQETNEAIIDQGQAIIEDNQATVSGGEEALPEKSETRHESETRHATDQVPEGARDNKHVSKAVEIDVSRNLDIFASPGKPGVSESGLSDAEVRARLKGPRTMQWNGYSHGTFGLIYSSSKESASEDGMEEETMMQEEHQASAQQEQTAAETGSVDGVATERQCLTPADQKTEPVAQSTFEKIKGFLFSNSEWRDDRPYPPNYAEQCISVQKALEWSKQRDNVSSNSRTYESDNVASSTYERNNAYSNSRRYERDNVSPKNMYNDNKRDESGLSFYPSFQGVRPKRVSDSAYQRSPLNPDLLGFPYPGSLPKQRRVSENDLPAAAARPEFQMDGPVELRKTPAQAPASATPAAETPVQVAPAQETPVQDSTAEPRADSLAGSIVGSVQMLKNFVTLHAAKVAGAESTPTPRAPLGQRDVNSPCLAQKRKRGATDDGDDAAAEHTVAEGHEESEAKRRGRLETSDMAADNTTTRPTGATGTGPIRRSTRRQVSLFNPFGRSANSAAMSKVSVRLPGAAAGTSLATPATPTPGPGDGRKYEAMLSKNTSANQGGALAPKSRLMGLLPLACLTPVSEKGEQKATGQPSPIKKTVRWAQALVTYSPENDVDDAGDRFMHNADDTSGKAIAAVPAIDNSGWAQHITAFDDAGDSFMVNSHVPWTKTTTNNTNTKTVKKTAASSRPVRSNRARQQQQQQEPGPMTAKAGVSSRKISAAAKAATTARRAKSMAANQMAAKHIATQGASGGTPTARRVTRA